MVVSSEIPGIDEYRNLLRCGNRRSGGLRAEFVPDSRTPGLVSVITVSYNSVDTIHKTIESVTAQTYSSVELIVIDGGSNDGTVDLLQKFNADIDVWISEPDEGISDAFNRGIALASGEYISIVNSDDWLEPDHLSVAIDELLQNHADFVFGDLMLHKRNGQEVNLFVGEPSYASRIAHYMPYLNHPTVVCLAAAFDKAGLFDKRLRTAMDYDWLLRLHKCGGRGFYSPRVLGHMTLEGESDRNFHSALSEVRDISIRNGYSKALAWGRYGYRLLKGNLRRRLQSLVPRPMYEHLRKTVNLNYKGLGPDK